MNEQLLKTSGANVLSSRKNKLRKTVLGGGSIGIAPLYVGGLIFLARNFLGHRLIFSNVNHAGKKTEAKARDRRKLLHSA